LKALSNTAIAGILYIFSFVKILSTGVTYVFSSTYKYIPSAAV